MAHGLLYGVSFKDGVLSFTDKQGRSLCEVSLIKYLTLTAVENNSSVALKKSGTVTNTYEYRKNGGAWTAYNLTTSGTAISLNAGDRVEWRCTAWNSSFSDKNYVYFVMTGKISASNPVTSMISPTLNHTTIEHYYACYNMFYGCKALTQAPELPATTLADDCYLDMFSGCTALTKAPELPATKLKSYCYASMFEGCTALVQAPELPATGLYESCYGRMFYGCYKLNYIKMLATDISASSCLNNWVNSVSSTGTFVKNAAMTSLPTGASGIPSGWTVQNA